MNDIEWMKIALEQAKNAQKIGEVPVGAVLVLDEKLISKAHNQPISSNDPTAHAEIQVLREAGKELNRASCNCSTLYQPL
jgi:tRNA(adenine34) deaminase